MARSGIKVRSWRGARLLVEELEARIALSAAWAPDVEALGVGTLAGRAARGIRNPIRLDLVALHEVGHSLGLDHSDNLDSILYPFYNPGYDINNFASDPIVPEFQALYEDVEASPWKNSLDLNPDNDVVEITYSFIPEGTPLEPGNQATGLPADTWQTIIEEQLGRWEEVSNGKVDFIPQTDAGLSFNYAGEPQNDGDSGDIRFGTHKIDRSGGTLAHAYFPPPNGATAAGDVHFDTADNWVDAEGNLLPLTQEEGSSGGGGSQPGNGKGNGKGSGKTTEGGNQEGQVDTPSGEELALALTQGQQRTVSPRSLVNDSRGPGTERSVVISNSPSSGNTGVRALRGPAEGGGADLEEAELGTTGDQKASEKPVQEPAPQAPPGKETPAPGDVPEGKQGKDPEKDSGSSHENLDSTVALPLAADVFFTHEQPLALRSATTLGAQPLLTSPLTELALALAGCWHLRPAERAVREGKGKKA
jgi:hypothetical protein